MKRRHFLATTAAFALAPLSLRAAEPKVSHEAQGALEFLCDHQVNPFRLTDAYTEGARQNGVDVYFNTNVTGVLHQGNRVSGVQTAEAGLFHCSTLINAAGAWAAELSQASSTAIALTKTILNQSFELSSHDVFAQGSQAQGICYTSSEHRASVEAFLAKAAGKE